MRRFIAFIVLAISLLGITLFNVQSNAEKINWSQEFGRGTEVVYHVEANDETSTIDMASLVEIMGNRLEEAGATSHKIDYAVDEGNRYEMRITLGSRYQADLDNILRSTISAGDLSLYTTEGGDGLVEPFVRGTAEVKYNENNQAYIRVEVKKELDSITKKAEDIGNKLLVLWQNKTEDMIYEELNSEDNLVEGKTNEQLKENVLAVINLGDTSSSEEEDTTNAIDNSLFTHDEDEDKYYITFDSFGYADNAESSTKMDASSAHSFERMLNSEKLDYQITEVYRQLVKASYGTNSATMMIWSVVLSVVVVSLYLIISYGLLSISGIVGICVTLLLDLLLINLFNIQVGPAMIIAVLVSLMMATVMLMNYYKRTKEEIYNGRVMNKASNEGFRKTISTAIDSVVLLSVLGIVLALISSESIKACSLFLLISSLLSILFVFLMSKCLNNYLLNSQVNENFKLFNVKKEYVKDLSGTAEKEQPESFVKKIDVTKHSKKTKWITFGSLIISLASILTFTFVSTSFNYSNEAIYGRVEVRFGDSSDDRITFNGEGLAENNFVAFLEDLDDSVKVTESWTITDQKNPYETVNDKNYIYFYANLEKPLAVDSDAFDKLETYVTSLDQEYGLVTSYEVHPGIVRGDFNNSLILILVTIGIGLVYFVIRYRYSFALSSVVSVISGSAISLGLISLCRLEVSAYVGVGVLGGLLMTLLLLIPLGNRIAQMKNESKVKVTTFDQRKEISLLAFHSYAEQYAILSIGFIVILLALIPLSSLEMAPVYVACAISLLINSALGFFMILPLHLWLEKHLKFTRIKSKRAELKKAQREKVAKANRNRGSEPEEIIIPGIND